MNADRKRTCGDCFFARPNADDFGRSKWCFRFPPTVAPVMVQNGIQQAVGGVNLRPQVTDTVEACGEYRTTTAVLLS